MMNNLSVLMGMKRISGTKVSEDTGISRNTIHLLYHQKTNNPDTQTVLKLSKYFGVTPNEFLGVEPIRQLKEVKQNV